MAISATNKPTAGSTAISSFNPFTATDSASKNPTTSVTWNAGGYTNFEAGKTYTGTLTVTPASGTTFSALLPSNVDTDDVDSDYTLTNGTVDTENDKITYDVSYTVPSNVTKIAGPLAYTVTAPAVLSTPAPNATYSSGTGVTNTHPTATWKSENGTSGSALVGGTGEYKDNFAAGVGEYYFDSDNLPTIHVNSNAAEVTYTDATRVHVKAIFDAIDKTVTKIAVGSPAEPPLTVGDTYSNTYPDVTLTYNDGDTRTVTGSVANYASNNLTVDGTELDNVSTTGAVSGVTVTADDNGAKVYVKYTGNADSGATEDDLKAIMATLTVTNDPLGDLGVNVALPAVGSVVSSRPTIGTPNPATGIKDSNATLTWYLAYTSESDNTPLITGKFEYGKTYYVKVDLTADTSYVFDVSGTAGPDITLTDTGSSSASIETDTITSTAEDNENIYAVFAVTYPTLAITDAEARDYYNNPTWSSTISGLASGDTVDKLYLNNVELAAADYLISGNTITINRSAIDKALGSNKANTLATSSASPTTYELKLTTTANTTGVTSTLSVYNTTPYLTAESSDGSITISGSPTEIDTTTNGKIYALTKGTAYTLTYAPTDSGHWINTNWEKTGDATSGTYATNTASTKKSQYNLTPADGDYHVTVTASKVAATGQTLVVTQPT